MITSRSIIRHFIAIMKEFFQKLHNKLLNTNKTQLHKITLASNEIIQKNSSKMNFFWFFCGFSAILVQFLMLISDMKVKFFLVEYSPCYTMISVSHFPKNMHFWPLKGAVFEVSKNCLRNKVPFFILFNLKKSEQIRHMNPELCAF